MIVIFLKGAKASRCTIIIYVQLLNIVAVEWLLSELTFIFDDVSFLFKAVTKAKLGYDPLEVNPEDMVRFAKENPQVGYTCIHLFTHVICCFFRNWVSYIFMQEGNT